MNTNIKYHTGLDYKRFVHQDDEYLLGIVKKLPFFDTAVNAMYKAAFEKIFRISSMGDDVRVSNKCCPQIYEYAVHCANVLDIPLPEIFINQSPYLNALTTGTDSPMIQLYSGLIDFLDEDELIYVIAHEMGHIKCGHVLYHSVARFLSYGSNFLGPFKIVADVSLGLALLRWSRKSELSADRAGLLVTQDVNPIITALMKLAGGSQKVFNQMDKDDFMEQSVLYNKMIDGLSENSISLYLNMMMDHPFPVVRASEIHEWSKNEQYINILNIGSVVVGPPHTNCPDELVSIGDLAKSIKLSWKPPTIDNIKGYNVYRSESDDGSFGLVTFINGKQNSCYIDVSLQDDTFYFYCVSSVDNYNSESEKSNTTSAKTRKPPRGLGQITGITDMVRSAEISWERYANPEPGMRIIVNRGLRIDKLREVAKLSINETLFIDSGLDDNVSYVYWIRVEEDGLFGEPDNSLPILTRPLPPAPKNISCRVVRDTIVFVWDKVGVASSYQIHKKRFLVDKIIGVSKSCAFTYNYVADGLKSPVDGVFYIKSIDGSSRASVKSCEVVVSS